MTQDQGINDAQLEQRMDQEVRDRIQVHMQVVDNQGAHVGTVDHLEGDTLKLTRSDTTAEGQHHYIPMSMVASADDVAVYLNLPLEQVKQSWTTKPQQ